MEEDTLPKSSDNTGGGEWDRNLPAVLDTEGNKFSVVATSLEQDKDRLPGMRVQMKQLRRDAGKVQEGGKDSRKHVYSLARKAERPSHSCRVHGGDGTWKGQTTSEKIP